MRRTCGRICLSVALLAWLAIAAWAQDAASPPATTPDAASPPLPSRFAVGVVADVKGVFQDNGADDDLQLDEAKVIAGGALSRAADARLTVDLGEPDARLEEAYVAFGRIAPRLGARVGKALVPFGMTNPIYPYRLPYADLPAAEQYLLGKEYAATGGEVIYRGGLTNGVHARLGYWSDSSQDDNLLDFPTLNIFNQELGAQFTDGFLLGRIWLGPDDARTSGLTLGGSAAIGDGSLTSEIRRQHVPNLDATVKLFGLDATYRNGLAGGQQWLLQTAGIRRRADDGYSEHQFGYYLLGVHRPSARWEYGARYDWSEVPYLYRVHETALTAFGTHYFTPDTYARLQLQRGHTREGDTRNEVILQLVTAVGRAPR